MADVILDADGDAVEQPFLLVLLYFLELLLTLWDKVSQAVCLLGHFQGLCWACGGTGVRKEQHHYRAAFSSYIDLQNTARITPSPEHPSSNHLKGLSSDGSDPGDRACFSLTICYIKGWS